MAVNQDPGELLILSLLSRFGAMRRTQGEEILTDLFSGEDAHWYLDRMVSRSIVYPSQDAEFICANPRVKPSRKMADAIQVLVQYLKGDKLYQASFSNEPYGIYFYDEDRNYLIVCESTIPSQTLTRLNRLGDEETIHILVVSDRNEAEELAKLQARIPHLFACVQHALPSFPVEFYAYQALVKEENI